jgi:hypothetical protein
VQLETDLCSNRGDDFNLYVDQSDVPIASEQEINKYLFVAKACTFNAFIEAPQ